MAKKKPPSPDTMLSQACLVGSEELIVAALGCGADPLSHDCLELAANAGASKGFEIMARAAKGKQGWDQRSKEALLSCVKDGREGPAMLLLALGVPADGETTPMGQSALSIAAMRGDLAIAKALTCAGASLRAIPGTRERFAEDQSSAPLREAIRAGKDESVKLLIELGAEVEALDSGGWNAAASAASRGEARCLRILIDAGARIDRINAWGSTPAMVAAANDRAECLMILAEAGADLDIVTSSGETLDSKAQGGAIAALAAIRERRALAAAVRAAESSEAPAAARL